MTLWILGSTGLTGKHLCHLIEADSFFTHIIAPVRRKSNSSSRINFIEVDFKSISDINNLPSPNIVFCAIGTTIKKAGSQEQFKDIDYDLVLKLAESAYQKGCKQFHLISSIGAKTTSTYFYLQVKGELEESLSKIPFESTYIYRPSTLIGNRNESRPAEKIGILFSQLISPLLLGSLKNYRPIKSSDLAKVMIDKAKHPLSGFHILESSEIKQKADSIY